MQSSIDALHAPTIQRHKTATADRLFYPVTSFIILALTFLAFQRFYLAGSGAFGPLTPQIAPLVIIHGVVLTGWVVLFFVQSVLIASRNRRLHMRLGLTALVLAPGIVVTGVWVAVAGTRLSPDVAIGGFPRPQFLLVLLAQMLAFGVFVALGLTMRKKPRRHRAMILMATIALLPPVTTRLAFLRDIFGLEGSWSVNGAQFVFGGLLLLVRLIVDRSFDRWFAAGYASLLCLMMVSQYLAVGESWGRVAKWILQI
jgi:hypothetical protein